MKGSPPVQPPASYIHNNLNGFMLIGFLGPPGFDLKNTDENTSLSYLTNMVERLKLSIP